MNIAKRKARMAPCTLQVATDSRLIYLVETHGAQDMQGTIRQQEESTSLRRRAQGVDPGVLKAATTWSGAGFLVPGGELRPDTLSDLGVCQLGDQGGQPLGLWVAGNPRLLGTLRAVVVVGVCATTGYGLHVVGELAADLNTPGWLVTSGLALGIGSVAHRGTLGVGDLTLAVMATGVDKAYPAGHHGLHNQIQTSSVVIMELVPGTRSLRASFLRQSRLITALGSGAMVVKTGARSGAHNTVPWAMELGRVTMAVPGPVTSSLPMALHHLIWESMAALVASTTGVIALLSPPETQEGLPLQGENQPIDSLSAPLRTAKEAVPTGTTLGATELTVATGMTAPEVIAVAAKLTKLGWLKDIEPGW